MPLYLLCIERFAELYISGEVSFVPNFFEPSFLPGLQNQRPDVFMAKKSSYIPPFKVGFTPDHAISGSYEAPPPFLCGITLLKRVQTGC
jgi:hypothetical protein